MTPTPPNTPSPDAVSAPLPPPRVPDHELIRRIGRGAYGEVWLARGVTGAFRAVKIVHRRSFDHARPFEREFEGILQFEPISRRHDSQVDILHVGRGDDCFYYVMELADDQATGGQIHPDAYAPRTLKSDLMFHGRLPFEECVRIGIALATALEHLHANGLVHRDVKPSNIIFVNGVPKLADIGLVTGVDATRSYVGTEGFAAPEGPGTAQADLYSLGKVLYEAATGKDRQEFPDLPTQLRELPDREGLVELNAVIARACRHDPKDRYASAAAMRADLELLQSGKSLARLHRTEARLRFVQRAGAVVTLAAALIAAGWFWQARQTRLVRDLADEKNRLANENRERLVRLDVANGVRLMDAGDLSGAALWFAAALPLVTNQPAEESIHRIRLQQVLADSPRLLQVWSHGGNVGSGAFSRDGRRIATVSANQEIRVWDAVSGALLMGPVDFGANPRDVRFNRDGRRLLVRQFNESAYPAPITSGRGRVAVFDSATGEVAFPAITNAVMAAFSPDDRWLAVARTNFDIEILDANTGQTVTELRGHTNQINMLTFSRDGSLLASASSDQTARLWRLPSGEESGPPFRHDGPVQRLALSPDAQRLATFAESDWWLGGHTVQTWSVEGGRPINSPIKVKKQLFALAFGETSGQWLFTGDNNRWMSVWDAECPILRRCHRSRWSKVPCAVGPSVRTESVSPLAVTTIRFAFGICGPGSRRLPGCATEGGWNPCNSAPMDPAF